MADNGKGINMSRLSCEWVHQRLPLLVGDADGISGEGSDLDAADRNRIERHLMECAPCSEFRVELEQTIAILQLAAQQPAIEPGTPSIWPVLEQQIRYHAEQSCSRWRRLGRAVCPQMVQNAIDRLDRSWGHLPGELPLRLVWARDSLREWTSGCSLFARSGETFDLGIPLRAVLPRLGIGLGLGIAAVVVLLAVAMADRQRSHAEGQIAANTTPIPMLETHRGQLREEAGHLATVTVPSTDTRVSSSLAQLDSAPPIEAPVPGQSPPSKAVGTATAAAIMVPTSSPRLDFDLEHGTPMPPETRGGKPTY